MFETSYLTKWIIGIFEWGIIFPGAIICFVPITKWMRFSSKKLFFSISVMLLCICIVMPLFEIEKQYNPNIFLYIVLVIGIFWYFFLVRLSNLKLFYLFSCSLCALSFGGISSHFLNSMVNPNGHSYDTSSWGLIVQWCISIVLVVFVIIAKQKIIWVFENFHDRNVWKISWIVPTIITICNISMIPTNYFVLRTGRTLQIGIIVFFIMLILFIFFQIVFYKIAKVTFDKSESEKKAQLLQIQSNQYDSILTYIEESRRLRHDFRHTIHTIDVLAKNGNCEDICTYLNKYEKTCDLKVTQFFCQYAPLNALLNYYNDLALEQHIETRWQINLMDKLTISDTDLSIIFGNLLENAITACKQLPLKQRYIYMTADTDTPGCMYIVINNSFSGEVKKDGDTFLSTKRKGHKRGIGLWSVTVAAEKYNGVTSFQIDDKVFISNVMLPF